MSNPHIYTKNSLLACIEILNKVGELKPAIKVRTKALPQVLEKTAEALKQFNHFQLTENTPQETLEELVCWGLLDIGFLGLEVPDHLLAILEKFTDKTVQAPEILEFDDTHLKEHMATPPVDDKGKVYTEEEGVKGKFYKGGHKMTDEEKELQDQLKESIAKCEKLQAKGKDKKVAKVTAEIEEIKAKIEALVPVEEKPKEEPEPKPKKDGKAKDKVKAAPKNPRIAEINQEIRILNQYMPEKKKKAKKQAKKIEALEIELAEIWNKETGQNAGPKTSDTDAKGSNGQTKPSTSTSPSRGVNARANRSIPDTISWPKPDSVTGTIVAFCQKKPRTVAEILAKLEKAFPERAISGMTKTVGALVGGKGLPLPLHYTKGIPCEVENDGTPEKTIFIPVSE